MPLTLAPDERIREPNDDVVRCAGEFADSMRASSDNRRIAKYLTANIIDIETANLVHSFLEHVGEDAGSIAAPAIWPRTSPLGRNDPLDGCPVAPHPCFGQGLLDLCQDDLISFSPGVLICCHSEGGRDYDSKGTYRQHGGRFQKSSPGHDVAVRSTIFFQISIR